MKLKKPKWIFLNKKTIINEKLLEPTVIGLKSKPTIITIKSVFLSFVLMSLISFPVLAESFCPSRLIDKKGSSSQQPLESLCDEDWSEFIEFMPDERGYKGIIVFRLKNIDTALLEDMSVHANFRGPDSDHQKWFFYLLDVDSGKWIKIMDNAQVSSWNWEMITKTISAEPTRFIDSRQRVKLRYSTLSSLDNSQLDYLALDLSLSDQASLPPSSESPLPPSSEPPVNPGAWWQPAPGNRWQVQYTGAVDTSLDVDVYNLDLFDTPKSVIDNLHSQGKKVICYFSAGSFEDWRPDAQQFPSEVKGQNLDGWPGEKWLDIRRLDILLPIMEARMDMAVQKNCDALDPDNVDSYTNNTGMRLTYQDQLNYNLAIAEAAHKRGLAVGLKNDLDQIRDLIDAFDFAVNEECFQYNECEMLQPFVAAGKAVFGIEYNLSTSAFCPEANRMNFDFLKKRLSLDAWQVSCR